MRLLLTLGLSLVLAGMAGTAQAVQLFDFDGQAHVPTQVGDPLDMVSVIVNGAQVPAPLPLDFDNYEYTLVVTGLTLDMTGFTDKYSGGTVTIYEDAATTADTTNPATFTDGTAILSGDVTQLDHTMFTATLGAAIGTVDWTGGTRVGDFAPGDELNWSLLVNVSRLASQVQPGYDERWDGKLEPKEGVVATSPTSFSRLKALW